MTSDHAGPTHVVLADLDKDGDQDLLTSSGFDGRIGWFENTDGKGTFGRLQVIAHDELFVQMAIAVDLDGDGDLHVAAVIAGDNRVAWYENLDGQGNFGAGQLVSADYPRVSSAAAGDLDGDGDLDIAAASAIDNSVIWLKNLDGRGGYSEKLIIDDTLTGAVDIEVHDLNGDQRPDLVVSSRGDAKVVWYENLGPDAGFGGRQVVLGGLIGMGSATAADLDGDGDLDIIATTIYGDDQDLVWMENQDG